MDRAIRHVHSWLRVNFTPGDRGEIPPYRNVDVLRKERDRPVSVQHGCSPLVLRTEGQRPYVSHSIIIRGEHLVRRILHAFHRTDIFQKNTCRPRAPPGVRTDRFRSGFSVERRAQHSQKVRAKLTHNERVAEAVGDVFYLGVAVDEKRAALAPKARTRECAAIGRMPAEDAHVACCVTGHSR